jgi:cytoskeletal protein RodZ
MQTIGEQLRLARLARDASIAEAAKATAMRGRYLEALEADDFDALPSPVQTRGFLRNYAAYLGLDPADLLAQFRSLAASSDVFEKVEEEPAAAPRTESGATPTNELALQAAQSTTTPGEAAEEARELAESEAAAPTPGPINGRRPAKSPQGEPVEGLIFPTLPYLDSGEEPEDDLPEERGTEVDEATLPISRSIFTEIGQRLSQRRELLSLSLDEIERHTRIPRHHLATLEAGDLDHLPSPVQARGMLTSYARFIDLDVESILLRFADALQAQRLERHPPRPRRRRAQTPGGMAARIRRLLSTDLVFGGGLVLALAVFAIWGTAQVITLREQGQGNVNAQSISEVLLSTPDGNLTPTVTLAASGEAANAFIPVPPSLPSETPTAFPTRFSSAPVQLIVIAGSRTWMRITADGKVEFEGRTAPGGVYSFEGESQIELLVADAGAIQLIYNREDIGSPGFAGEVSNLIYTAEAVLLPTPTITPSPTRTPRPSATPRPTSTPRLTPTPPGPTAPIG